MGLNSELLFYKTLMYGLYSLTSTNGIFLTKWWFFDFLQ